MIEINFHEAHKKNRLNARKTNLNWNSMLQFFLGVSCFFRFIPFFHHRFIWFVWPQHIFTFKIVSKFKVHDCGSHSGGINDIEPKVFQYNFPVVESFSLVKTYGYWIICKEQNAKRSNQNVAGTPNFKVLLFPFHKRTFGRIVFIQCHNPIRLHFVIEVRWLCKTLMQFNLTRNRISVPIRLRNYISESFSRSFISINCCCWWCSWLWQLPSCGHLLLACACTFMDQAVGCWLLSSR